MSCWDAQSTYELNERVHLYYHILICIIICIKTCSFLQQELDKDKDFRGMLFKLLNCVFHAKTFYMKVSLKYQSNPFFNSINHMLLPHHFA